MATKRIALLLLYIFLFTASTQALSTQDPELQQCRHQCQQQKQFSERERRECERRCEEYARQKEEREREEREREGHREREGVLGQGSPEERLQQCQRQCETQHRHDPSQCSQCKRRCQERYAEERREQEPRREDVVGQGSPQERLQQCQRQCETQHRHDPSQMSQCQSRCQERYEKERREQQEPEREDVLGQRSPGERLQQCRRQCETQHRQDPSQLSQCQRRCQERYEEERREQQEPRREDVLGQGSPKERLRQCQRKCETQHGHDPSQLSQCQRRCQERYEQEQRERGSRGGEANPRREEEEEEQEEQQQGRSPYFFDQQSFQHRVRTTHGSVRVLERFTRRSELLRGIENYRLAFLEANPNAFVLPHHIDADTIYYVVRGCGAIKMLREENRRESYNIRRGDIIRAHAGSVVYIINTDNNEKLYIAKLMRTVFTPGVVREYFGVGGQDPESFFRSFSNELLQAAFNARREAVDRMFGKQTKGAIIRASQEQIRAMSRGGSSEGGRWPFGESSRPFNLLSKRPTHSSRHGQLHEASADDYQELQDLDVQISFANISSGSMTAPFYLTRSTKIVMVVEGEGCVEMACPHVSSESQERREREEEEREAQGQPRRVHYQKMTSRLSPGTVFIVPAGHPVAIVSSSGQNLQVLCFEINAKNNQRIYLAGKNSILKQLEREAKELSFDMPAREVDEFLNRQEESELVGGPEQRREKSLRLGSILEFAGF